MPATTSGTSHGCFTSRIAVSPLGIPNQSATMTSIATGWRQSQLRMGPSWRASRSLNGGVTGVAAGPAGSAPATGSAGSAGSGRSPPGARFAAMLRRPSDARARRRRRALASEGRLSIAANRAPGGDLPDPALPALPVAGALPAGPAATPVTPPFSERDARQLGPIRNWLWRHPVAMDVIVALWFGIPSGLTAILEVKQPWLVPLVVAGMVALMARRRAPLLVLAAVTALGITAAVGFGGLNGFDFAVAFAVYAVAVARSCLLYTSPSP